MSGEDDSDYNAGYQAASADTADAFKDKFIERIDGEITDLEGAVQSAQFALNILRKQRAWAVRCAD